MKKDSIIDYWGYTALRLISPIINSLPLEFSLFLGRRMGDLLYYFDFKHKAIAYSNIKKALGARLSPLELSGLTHEFYCAFGQSLIEILLIPSVDKEYLHNYVNIQGLDNVNLGFKKGKGVIILGVHAGSWEFFNIICANLGFPFTLFVRNQRRYPRIEGFLNSYRIQKGCKIIQRATGSSPDEQSEFYGTRQLVEALKRNEAVVMSIDQGGKFGALVKFFGYEASMATGAVRLALKQGVTIIPAFFTRLKGPNIKIIMEPPFEMKKSGEHKKDIHDNLQRLISIFEKHIAMYPKEYLWTYKIWKYGDQRNILILSDGKTGHLRQTQTVAKIVGSYFKDKGITINIDTVEIKFKNKFTKPALIFSSCLAGKYHCQGCLWCLKAFLKRDCYLSLIRLKADVIISCGSSVAPINFVLSRENLAKSIVIMRPSILSTKRFGLVIMPRHDNPPKRKNIVVTAGALNLVNEGYLREETEKLIRVSDVRCRMPGFCIGLLIGGGTKNFCLDKEVISGVIKQIKSVSVKLDATILITTSRRTSEEIENLIKQEFKDYPRSKLLIIANENNIPEAVGGILGLSQIVITSPESISMISEAASSGKYVLVFSSSGLSKRHRQFLDYFTQNEYIYLTEVLDLSERIEEIWRDKPPIHVLSDNLLVREAIEKIL